MSCVIGTNVQWKKKKLRCGPIEGSIENIDVDVDGHSIDSFLAAVIGLSREKCPLSRATDEQKMSLLLSPSGELNRFHLSQTIECLRR